MQTHKISEKMALRYHEEERPGKIEVVPTKPYRTQRDLSLAYSPGVAYPCLAIEKNPEDAYRYTDKGNLVAVISNGTAVLGLGDIGPQAAKPVMEGKALLFKIFSGLDAFDIEIDEKDPKKFIEIVKSLQYTFGGINLEDIKAPECFEIEKSLREKCNIPVMHDDQHGTAIISSAGLINALEIQGKEIGDVKLVVNGAGAAAVACTRLYERIGIKRENIVMCDSKGVIRADRANLTEVKREFATTRDIHTLAEALKGADVFLGLSVANVLTPEMVKSMASKPIVFALANPDPEIEYEKAVAAVPDIVIATGRSDYPNQINNVIGFPYIFRGALDVQATAINEEMKIAAVRAIAKLAHEPVPAVVGMAYGSDTIKFGRDYIIPKALDPRLLTAVAPAVAKAAIDSGVARKTITDWDEYDLHLRSLMGDNGKTIRRVYEMARNNKKKVVFTHPVHEQTLIAVSVLAHDNILTPVLIGKEEEINKAASEYGINLRGIEIINPHSEKEASRRKQYAKMLAEDLSREGMTFEEATACVSSSIYFGLMMVKNGDADSIICGVYSAANDTARIARRVIGMKEGYDTVASMHVLNTRHGTYYLADTTINPEPSEVSLVEITYMASEMVKGFGVEPVCAMLSYSNYGSNGTEKEPLRVARAVKTLHEKYPEISVDGEMQSNYALNTTLRDKIYPFNTIKNKDVNTLIFPSLSSANITARMLLESGVGSLTGPITMGLKKSVHFINVNSDAREIMDLAAISAIICL